MSEPEAQAQTDWWSAQRQELALLMARADAREFLTWQPVYKTMVIGTTSRAFVELRALRSEPGWHDRWAPSLREDPVGLPAPFAPFPRSSGTLIHHLFHVARFERLTDRRVNEFEAVVEFGGGYGSLLRVFANLGFSGRYHIHDLPEFGALQRFYYSSILDLRGPALKDPPDATFSSDPREAEEVVSTNFGGTLFVATWSLSEAPLETRERWRPVLDEVQYFLIAYQPVFAGIDNERWFAELRSSRPDVTWAVAPVPRASGDRYLVGAAGG